MFQPRSGAQVTRGRQLVAKPSRQEAPRLCCADWRPCLSADIEHANSGKKMLHETSAILSDLV